MVFHYTILNKICQEIANTPRRDLFRNINSTLLNALFNPNKSDRIPLVTTWHHTLSGFQSILHRRYQGMINEYPYLKCIFYEPPTLSFRRNKNLRNRLVHSFLTEPTPNTHFTSGHSNPCSSKRGKGCTLCSAMSNTNSKTNKLTNKSCLTSGGKCNTTDTIYAAECMKYDLIYVGHSSQKLSGRFNGHRSDVKVKPKACELSQHFHESKNCKIEKDLKVYILQNNATGTREKREFIEDRGITRLNTKSPNGITQT